MAYIGNQLTSGPFRVENFTGDGLTTAFTLAEAPGSASSILVTVNGVKRIATGASAEYTLNGRTLTFTSPPANASLIEVLYLGLASTVNLPGDATVTANQLSTDLRQIIVSTFTANGTGQTFNLETTPVSANSLIVSSNGVVQYDYTVSGSTLIFNFTPPSGAYIRVASVGILATGNVANDSISTVKIQNQAVTGDKIAPNAIRGNNIVVATITGNLIAGTSIRGNQIATSTLTGNLFAANTITGDIIGQNSVSANNLNLTYSSSAFLANGTGNTYTVTTGHDANSILVFLNGICMLPVSDYSVTGTTLLFTFTPTANSNVSVRYLPV